MIASLKSTAAFGALACFALLFTAPAAHADQVGDTVTCAQTGGGDFTCFPATSTVGTGTTFQVGPTAQDAYIDVDFYAGGMSLLFVQTADLQHTVLQFDDLTTPWTSIALLSQTGMTGLNVGGTQYPGFNASDLSINNGVLTVNLQDTYDQAGNGFTAAFGAAPEPNSFLLLGTGMLAMFEVLRRRQRA
jgi:hypothetical protein